MAFPDDNTNFDPQTFLATTLTGPSSTEMLNCPEGEYDAIIDKFDAVPWQGKDNHGLKLVVTWNIEDQGVRDFLSRPKVLIKQDVMLDLNESNQLDMGKGRNVSLGRLREAIGKNTGNFSFLELAGCMAKVKVKHRLGKDENAGKIFPFIDAAARR